MEKFYRIKHIPSGLYYQPLRNGGSHLGKKGKIYTTALNGVDQSENEEVYIQAQKGSTVYKKLTEELGYPSKDRYGSSWAVSYRIPKVEFTKEYISNE